MSALITRVCSRGIDCVCVVVVRSGLSQSGDKRMTQEQDVGDRIQGGICRQEDAGSKSFWDNSA